MIAKEIFKDFIPTFDLGKETKRWGQVYKILNEPKPDIIPAAREETGFMK
jgi:hypothetical protein